jgi:hypothetical protein
MTKLRNWLKGPPALSALAGVVAAAVVLAVAELVGAFFTARAAPLLALGSTFIDFTPPWLKDFAIATFGTNDKAALFVGMGLTIALLACVLGVVAYRRWALGVLGVLFMGAVIVASVVTRAGVEPIDAVPSVLGTLAGLVVLRRLLAPLHGMKQWPEAPADAAPGNPATSRRRFFAVWPGPASPQREDAFSVPPAATSPRPGKPSSCRPRPKPHPPFPPAYSQPRPACRPG